MSPNTTTVEEQFQFLISCIKHSREGKVNFEAVAQECDIISKGAAAKRYERLMKAHGIHPSSFPSKGKGKENGNSDGAATPAKRKANSSAAATPRKTSVKKSKKEAVIASAEKIVEKHSDDTKVKDEEVDEDAPDMEDYDEDNVA
ncbi:hypothetical protein PHISCL_07732 [Aspergillus sclerotialis]|uniref:Myb-like DNA-binding domain-containing protein n=1 Tax=Aspergillus sclerotialis TaxID=2070753 RepID=A0A3A2Z9Y7_9EURO|nr:hypothetical protein PHISCL_07732 [Aspergillus sclerotialis]